MMALAASHLDLDANVLVQPPRLGLVEVFLVGVPGLGARLHDQLPMPPRDQLCKHVLKVLGHLLR